MTIQIDPVITKKLILVKQLYQQALSQSKIRHSDVGRITSIVIFDLATETMLKTIALALDPKKDPDKTFEALIQQTDDLMTKASLQSLPDKTPIRHVHSIRNDAQHKARYPNDAEVNDCRTYTRDFLTAVCSQIWGKDFEKISMVDVVQHQEVRSDLLQAERALSENNYEKALAYAKEGLNHAISLAGRVVVPTFDGERTGVVTSDGYEQNINFDLFAAFREIARLSTLSALGINNAEFIKYESVASCLSTIRFTDDRIEWNRDRELPNPDDIDFAISYAINTVAQIEGYVGNLERPFDKE